MMYLAPRQGLFAIIVLVSFCLQTLLMVISIDHQLTKSLEQKGEQMMSQLIDESRLSLENHDRVSLSVIANRYISEQDVARLEIKDNKGNILVPVGNAPLQQGQTLSQIATNGNSVIGSVNLTLKDISKGEIIAMQWPFVIGTLILHLLLWVAYGFVARPTQAQINALKNELKSLEDRVLKTKQAAQLSSEGGELVKSKVLGGSSSDTHQELNHYLQSQQQSQQQKSPSKLDAAPTKAAPIDRIKSTPTILTNKLSASRSFDQVTVQIVFQDDHGMLKLLAPESRDPYFTLCSQLLQQALFELLQLPLLQGVSVINQPMFKGSSAVIMLKAEDATAKVALAGVMLGKLYLMLNKIIFEKHVELDHFALHVKVGVSDSAHANAMAQLLARVGKKEQQLILLPNLALKQIGSYVQIHSVSRPTNVYERECAVFDGGSPAMMEMLSKLRNNVLLTGHDEALLA